jgi:hypothetical protein
MTCPNGYLKDMVHLILAKLAREENKCSPREKAHLSK